ncbi:MAG: hypothetical protein ACOC20_07750, partial [Oceanicaulis sp.]
RGTDVDGVMVTALRRMGFKPQSASTRGAPAYAKAALSRGWKAMEKITGRASRPLPKSETTFDVDPMSDTGFRDRAAA